MHPIANIQAVRLANHRQVSASFIGQLGFLSGWGRSLFSPGQPPQAAGVRFSHSQLSQNSMCRLLYPNLIESGQFCSVSSEPTGPFCPVSVALLTIGLFYIVQFVLCVLQADAGGPIIVFEADGAPTQIGVTSFLSGLGCSDFRPAVFGRLNFYLRWVTQVSGITIANDFTF